MKAILYFERIMEQDKERMGHYNYGLLNDKCRKEIETKLIELLEYQIEQHEDEDEELKTDDDVDGNYIFELFAHFCDCKTFVDLSCIDTELQEMNDNLKQILFPSIDQGKYEINVKIFPHLREYKDLNDELKKVC